MNHTQKILCSTILILLAGGAVLPAPGSAETSLSEVPVRFAVLGDRTSGAIDPIHWEIIEEIERLQPEFVITVGDMVEVSPADSGEYESAVKEYRSHLAGLSAPIYFTAGNNDVETEDMTPYFKRYFNDPYFSFDHRGLHVVVLNNAYIDNASQWPDEQLEWLKADLAEHDSAEQTVDFHHKPFWRETIVRGIDAPLHDIMKTYGVDAVFTGHYHRYFSGDIDGIRYTGMGPSGGGISDDTTLISHHFGWVTVTADEFLVTPIRYGSAMPWDLNPVEADISSRKSQYLGVQFVTGAQISSNLTVESDSVAAVIRNFSVDHTMRDTLRWTVPEAWSVEPMSLPLTVAPGDSALVSFQVSCRGPVYPRPSLTVSFPWIEQRPYTVNRDLCVRRPAVASRVTAPLELDGVRSEPCWSEAQSVFYGSGGDTAELAPTAMYYAYDSEFLYFAANSEVLAPDSLKTDVTGRDGGVYTDDCVGFLFQPDPRVDTAFQVYVNSAGTIWDITIARQPEGFFHGTETWNGNWEVATRTSDNGWSVELRIPWSELASPDGPPEMSLMNCRRKQQRPPVSGFWQPNWIWDSSGWGTILFPR